MNYELKLSMVVAEDHPQHILRAMTDCANSHNIVRHCAENCLQGLTKMTPTRSLTLQPERILAENSDLKGSGGSAFL